MTESRARTEDLPYWLAFVCTPGIGPVTAKTLLAQWGEPRDAFEAWITDTRSLGRLEEAANSFFQQLDWRAVESDLRWLVQAHCHAITLKDTAYPPQLKEITDPPLGLFAQGDTNILTSIVGSRNPGAAGELIAAEFARHVAEGGFTVISGMAVGIDAAAYRDALQGTGRTIGVAGTGLDRIYPARHRNPAPGIKAYGALISESPRHTIAAGSAETTSPVIDQLQELRNLLRHIGLEPRNDYTLVERSGLTAEQVSSMLMVLELHRHVASAPGGLYTRIH